MINEIISIIIALAGFPAGLVIAKLTQEELKPGRIWFTILAIAAAIASIASAIFARGNVMLLLAASFGFIMLLAIAALAYKARPKARRRR